MPVHHPAARLAQLAAAVLLGLECLTAWADPGAAAAEPAWRRAELYFGIGPWHSAHAARDARRWQHFLDEEVTPRFPQGFSVVDAYGQWLPEHARHPERLRSKILLILYPDTPARAADLEALRSAWKQRSGDTSVLRVDLPAAVAF